MAFDPLPLPKPIPNLDAIADPRWYPATIESVPDGDTVVVTIDRGHDQISRRQSIRLRGIDTAESNDPDQRLASLGQLAKVMIQAWLPIGSTCFLATYKTPKSKREEIEKFGRFQGDFVLAFNPGRTVAIELTAWLVTNRLAVPYHGQKKHRIVNDHLHNYHHHAERGSFSILDTPTP
jgi:hypothetical protein